jgi:hypothetical protein
MTNNCYDNKKGANIKQNIDQMAPLLSQSSLKKMTKSITTSFKESNKSLNSKTFTHSTSYDNMSSLRAISSSNMNALNNPFNNKQSNNEQFQSMSKSSSNTYDDSSQSDSADKRSILLHVRNLDYKISSDEWKRILSDNFRKHCKEVLFYLKIKTIQCYFIN